MTTESGSLFLAPDPDGKKPVPEPPNLGPCQFLVEPASLKECGAKGTSKVRVDTREVPAVIIMCAEHRWEMNQAMAARRQLRKNAS